MKNKVRISCRKAERAILGGLDGAPSITATDEAALRAHVAACPRCARLASTAMGQSESLRRLLSAADAAAPVPGALSARALANWDGERRGLRRAPKTAIHPALRRSVLAGSLAATAAGLSLAGWWNYRLNPAATPTVAVASPVPQIRERERPVSKSPVAIPVVKPKVFTASAEKAGRVANPSLPVTRVRLPKALAPTMMPRVVATRPETPAPVGDDMAYVAPDPKAFAARWAGLSEDETTRLEAEIRASVKGGDDFVDVPFPRIAANDRAAVAEAIRNYRQEAETVDSRLQRKVTLGLKRASFADLCEKLTRETGVTFTAQKGVADDKVTLFCKDRPVRDLMRAVARLFNFAWDRQGDEGGYTYRLKQPLQAQLLEEELRNKDRNDALLALDKEMDRYRSLLNLSPEEARARAAGATGRDKEMLDAYGAGGWGPVNLYFGLSNDQMGALRDGQTLNFRGAEPEGVGASVPGMVGFAGNKAEPMAPAMSQQILQSLSEIARVAKDPSGNGYSLWINSQGFKKDAAGVPPAAMPGTAGMAALRLTSTELGRFELQGGSGVTAPGERGGAAMMTMPLAVGVSPSARDPKNAEANKSLADQPGMKDKVTLPTGEKGAGTTKDDERVTTADVLEAIHKATGKDVIGDYYTKLFDRKAVLPAGELPLFDALCRASDAARLRWATDDRWLTFRSVSFFNDRPKEVPNRLLERWQAAKTRNQGALPTESLIEVARLSDAQLDAEGTAEGARRLYGLDEWDLVRRNLRPSWRLLADMGNGARQGAFGREGLGFAQMTLAQQQEFAKIALGDANSPAATQENLAAATLHVYVGPKARKTAPPSGGDQLRPVSLPVGASAPEKPEWTAKFIYRWKTKDGPQIREITMGGMMAGRDNGKEPAID